tara:strand:+ start:2162 stop:3127 length:966 start_codon:yes stop_codon:yes gene_type:complete
MKKVMFTLKSGPPKKNGAAGGGAFFVRNMARFLENKGCNVIYTLDPNIDIIFVIDPRKNSTNNYKIEEIIRYKEKNPNVKIIHRVNECDIKREKSINIEPLLLKAMKTADCVIFVSKWLESYFLKKYNIKQKTLSILNGIDTNIFHRNRPQESLNHIPFKDEKIRLVTHHFSDNYLKGFHIYNKLDEILPNYPNIEFTYIGNYNKNYKPKNIKIIGQCSGKELADIIRSHDIYITATQNEPGAMHYIEGMACGLPVLYCVGGGGAKEICSMAGEEYVDLKEFMEKIQKIKDNYQDYVDKIDNLYLSSHRCSNEYFTIINSI